MSADLQASPSLLQHHFASCSPPICKITWERDPHSAFLAQSAYVTKKSNVYVVSTSLFQIVRVDNKLRQTVLLLENLGLGMPCL